MALRTIWILISAVAVMAQQPQNLSHSDLRRRIANANKPADYQVLADYFHYQEQVYRAKANAEMHDYVKYFSLYHPKFPTGADNAARLFEYYSAKADKEAKLAAHYDELLVQSGVKPTGKGQIVPLKDLENQPPKQAATPVLPKKQAAPGSSTPHETQ